MPTALSITSPLRAASSTALDLPTTLPENRSKRPSWHQLVPPHLPFYSESHLYREEVDQFLLNAAIKYGADYAEETPHHGCPESAQMAW